MIGKLMKFFRKQPIVYLSLGLDSYNNKPISGKVWCLGLYQVPATRFENDEGDNQARAFSGDKCIYAAPLLSDLGAHYICEAVDIKDVITAFNTLKQALTHKTEE
jgi:hypothetical protein